MNNNSGGQETQPILSTAKTTSKTTTATTPEPYSFTARSTRDTTPLSSSSVQPAPQSRPPPPPTSWPMASTQFSSFQSSTRGFESIPLQEAAAVTWSQRFNLSANNQSQGFIWDSLDSSMEDVQEARKTRGNGPIRLLTNRKDTSYNTVRSTLRLQYAEKRRSDIRNFVSSIRLGLDYDLYKAKAMSLLNSKARIIFFIIIDLIVDTLFCILYLVETEWLITNPIDPEKYPNPHWLFVNRPRPIWVIAVAMSSWNLMSAFIRFIFADNKWRFIFSIQTLLDAVTAIPFLVSGFFLPDGQSFYVPYFLRSWSVISRLQRALSIGVDIGISDQPFDPVKAKLIALVFYFVAILYNGMAAFLYCESQFAPHNATPSVGDAFYFILITASTVGYGDITPKSFEAKVVIMMFIIVALSIVPGLIAGTIETIKSSRSGGGSYTQSRAANGAVKQYLVMIGDFQNAKRVGDMLHGFFNKEFSDNDVRVVFLSRNKPSRDVKTLLDMPTYKNRTTMLVGNGLDESDLKRCQARDAGAVFVIPDRITSGLESQDTMTTLLAWSIYIYAPNTRIFTFNLLPETESFQWGVVEQSMCISDVKQLLLAYSCRHRGTATLILNLLHPSEPANSYDDGWQAQYGDGTGNELYVGPVPSVFIGWTFAQASWFVFQEFQSVLIGIDIFLKAENGFTGESINTVHDHDSSRSDPRSKLHSRSRSKSRTNTRGLYDLDTSVDCPNGQYHLTLNPGNSYRLGKFDQLVFIAQSPNDVDAISKFTMEQYERLVKDEKGYLEASRVDFAKANAMYQNLRESRADARAAAKRRAEQRKRARKARREDPGAAIQTSPTGLEYDLLSSPQPLTSQHLSETNDPAGTYPPDSRRNGSTTSKTGSARYRLNSSQKKSRPAWNVALYDDDDDDDNLSDSRSSDKMKTEVSVHSRLSHRGRRSESREREHLAGALERETLGDVNMSPTQAKFWNGSRSSMAGNAGSPMLKSRALLSSNFDRNAAAAAARDQPLCADGSESNAHEPSTSAFLNSYSAGSNYIVSKSTEGIVEVSKQIQMLDVQPSEPVMSPSDSISVERPAPKSRLTRASARGSFQILDESTYIGQTSVTRSETKDLPLCHLLINPPETIKPLIKEDLSSLRNHIVVCADMSENLYRFLATLRLAQINREDLKTIVVLTRNPLENFASDRSVAPGHGDQPEVQNATLGPASVPVDDRAKEPCTGNWDAILSFPRVFWVSGNCRHQRDLVRAGILGASSIVIMSHSVEGLDRDEFADSTAIMSHHMTYQTLRQRDLLGRQHIIVEIAERSNIRFLNMRDVTDDKSRDGIQTKIKGNSGFVMTPLFASGQVLVSSLLDNVLFQAYSKTHILDLVKLCCGVRFKQAIELDQMLGIDSSNICLIETPPEFVGHSFLKLFQVLALLYGIIPMGLYRAPDLELNNQLPFVFTNPLPGILLKATDMIYVLKS